jgi:hypothetical protein
MASTELFGHEWEEFVDNWEELDGLDDEPYNLDEDDPSPQDEVDPTEDRQEIQPPGWHGVAQGETLASIACLYGHVWDTIWSHPENARLRDMRNPGLLSPGDKVYIPDKEPGCVTVKAGKRHTFVLQRPMVWFRLQITDGEQHPAVNIAYSIQFEGCAKVLEGTTESDGMIEGQVPAHVKRGELTLSFPGSPDHGEVAYTVFCGALDPSSKETGTLARLSNLGICISPFTTDEGMYTAAVKGFQASMGLEPTGELDQDTKETLERLHDTFTEPKDGQA